MKKLALNLAAAVLLGLAALLGAKLDLDQALKQVIGGDVSAAGEVLETAPDAR